MDSVSNGFSPVEKSLFQPGVPSVNPSFRGRNFPYPKIASLAILFAPISANIRHPPSAIRQHPLLVFLVHMAQSILLRQIAYLKAENAILRSRAGKQVQSTPAERALLVRLCAPLGKAIQHSGTVVDLLRRVREHQNLNPDPRVARRLHRTSRI